MILDIAETAPSCLTGAPSNEWFALNTELSAQSRQLRLCQRFGTGVEKGRIRHRPSGHRMGGYIHHGS